MDQTQADLAQYIKGFRGQLESTGRASATILAYSKDIEQLGEFVKKAGKTTASAITSEDIDNFKADLDSKHYTAKSISRKLNSIKAFFRHLKAQNLVEANPAAAISHPKYDLKPPRVLSKLEYRALRDACRSDARISAIVEMLLQTGMRISELANLATSDIDLANMKITIRAYESHGEREVPLNTAAKAALGVYLNERPKGGAKTSSLPEPVIPSSFVISEVASTASSSWPESRTPKLTIFVTLSSPNSSWPVLPWFMSSKLAGHKRLSTTEKYLEFISEKGSKEKLRLEEL